MGRTQGFDPRRRDAATQPFYGGPLAATEPAERAGETQYYAGGWQPAPQSWLLRELHLWQAANQLNLNIEAAIGVQPEPQFWAAGRNPGPYGDLEAPLPDVATSYSQIATPGGAVVDGTQYAGLRAPTSYDAY